jgi:hypothetical protein
LKLIALLGVTGAASPALADELVFRFAGTINLVEGNAPVEVGATFTFEYRFDSETPDKDPDPTFGRYTGAILDADVDLGGVFQFESAPGDILVLNDPVGDIYSGQVVGPTGSATVLLFDPLAMALASDELPETLALESFFVRAFRFAVKTGPSLWAVEGDITKFTVVSVVCYPDCNSDGALNLADFGCFQTRFALGDPYADCNGDTVLNLADFGCWQTVFALGCP